MLALELRSKHPHHTQGLHVSGPVAEVDAFERDVLPDLAADGWAPAPSAPALSASDRELALMSPGTGLFGGWTDAERRTKRRRLRAALGRHNLTITGERRLGLADLI